MKIYINEGSFGFAMSPLEKIDLISNSQFSGIGLWFEKLDLWLDQENADPQEIKALLQTKNVDVIEINFLKSLFTHEYENPILQHEISQGVYYAKLFGAPFLTAATFGESLQPSLYRENIRKLSEKLEQEGLSLAIEFLPWTEIPSITELQELLAAVDRENVGILLDTYHFFMGDPDLNALKKIPPEKIFLIHSNDLVKNPDLFSKLSLIEITRGYRVAPGLGDFPLIQFFKTLREMGVKAPVSLEVLNKDSASQRHIESVLNAYTSTLQQIGA
ncbi:sugar phosphate isomerase/epimerase family protein [Pseudomonas chlororaphis]|uniref:sugar phosphate isomerase/epimerase family protein n=1 Tax=Pseudomonas chlororaphis TaxID=587753 RepID=UPI001B311E66|nr:sugar phosphate isomerase/epimerase family protein [Pseudomonas chlororaphis]MBP5059771.1 sugar phosphate isomerase/epimerase [Pseudomonas chlororaphis]MBP5138874.1 sugar phosphate isomerase/epimerase [Pseudomonas chlororaphis]QTT98618.1 sugar phosphate isomerase/epimerase [Pseudomonas chlororaphis]